MSKYRAALFDMDGTLFNTKRGIVKALRLAIEEFGLEPLKEGEEEQFIGPPIQKTMGQAGKSLLTVRTFSENITGKRAMSSNVTFTKGWKSALQLLRSME